MGEFPLQMNAPTPLCVPMVGLRLMAPVSNSTGFLKTTKLPLKDAKLKVPNFLNLKAMLKVLPFVKWPKLLVWETFGSVSMILLMKEIGVCYLWVCSEGHQFEF